MKRSLLKIATHATALLVGALLAPTLAGVMAIIIHPSTGSTAATGAAPLTGPSSTADAALSTPRTSRSEAFRQAWRELSLRPATRETRLDNQRKLLKLWAGFDLDGALHAAATEGGSLWFEGNNVAQLFEVFADDFGQHPEEAWRILARNDFGLDQCQLQRRWLEQLHDRPGIIISHLGEMNSFQQEEAMSVIRNSSPNPTEIRTALMKSGIGESQLADFLLSSRSLTPGDSMDWAAQPAGPERTAARAGWVAHLATLDPAAYAAAWETVPAADRAEVARLTVKMLHGSPLLLPALDHLIATDQWDILGSDVISSSFHAQATADPFAPNAGSSTASAAQGPDHAALVDWASDLPDRPETSRVLEELLPPQDPFSSTGDSNPDGSIPGLDDFPPGTWQHDEILLIEITHNAASPRAVVLAGQITGPARQQQAQDLIRRAALLKSMRQ